MYNSTWYNSLIQPPFTPPAWVFPPAWTFLYLTLFVALVLFSVKPNYRDKKRGYVLFFSQLILNLTWPPVFFLFKSPGIALIIIIFLDVLVLLNIIEFWKVSKGAAITLLPYFIWILFATYLNLGFQVINQ